MIKEEEEGLTENQSAKKNEREVALHLFINKQIRKLWFDYSFRLQVFIVQH